MIPNQAEEKIELDWLKRWALYSPNRAALQCADTNRIFTYKELYERSNMLAQNLREESGIRAGDRVAMLSLNEPEYVFLFFALQRIGAILVPVNYRLSPREIDHILTDSAAKLFIAQEAYDETVSKLTARPENTISFKSLCDKIFSSTPKHLMEMESSFTSPVMILYTSGTTGAPKGALITNKMIFWNSVNTGLRLKITQDDSAIIFHPMFHTSGWNVLTTPFFHHGARILLLKKFSSEKVLEIAESEKASILFGVPTMMDMMARTEKFSTVKLESVRYAIVGGEPMPIPLIRTWAKKGIPIRQGYGLTEFGPNVFSLNEEDAIRKIGSIGFPNFYIDAKIMDNNQKEITSPDVVGELALRGPAVTGGYWNNAKATAEALRDGWFYTGDLVRRDEDGYFYVVGRKKDMFISGAENVYPAEIEQFLRTHSAIREIAVVGVKDERWGEVGKAFYSTNSGAPLTDDELQQFCLGNLAKYKIPKSFVHLKELPKGESGKILKRALI